MMASAVVVGTWLIGVGVILTFLGAPVGICFVSLGVVLIRSIVQQALASLSR